MTFFEPKKSIVTDKGIQNKAPEHYGNVMKDKNSETLRDPIIGNELTAELPSEKHHRYDYTDILFWLGILMLTAWIIGKLTGLIHSPVWIEQFPFITALITILSIGLKAGRILQKLDDVIDAVEKLNNNEKARDKTFPKNVKGLSSENYLKTQMVNIVVLI